MVCKIVFCSEFPDIPDKGNRATTRRRTQTIAKPYAFHANAINNTRHYLQTFTVLTNLYCFYKNVSFLYLLKISENLQVF